MSSGNSCFKAGRSGRYGSILLLLCLLAMMGCAGGTRAQGNGGQVEAPFPIQERYKKSEIYIPMRDGVKLFTAVYVPNDETVAHPIIMVRTPYGTRPYGENSYPTPRGTVLKFMEAGYIVVNQDVRGRYLSEGTFLDVRPVDAALQGAGATDESTDTYDTIDYLVKKIPHNNGKVGIWGISYPGYYAAAGGVNSHPALKAISPEAPVSDWFIGDDDHHNGALFVMDCFSFLCFFGPDREAPSTESKPFVPYNPTDAYQFYLDLGPLKNINARYFHDKVAYWNAVTQHPNYDAFWQARALPAHLKGVHCAVLTVGGWYDAEDLYGPFAVSRSIQKFNPQTPNSLVIGPWPHGGWGNGDFESFGDEKFGQKTGAFYRDQILMPFFNRYLLDTKHNGQDKGAGFSADGRPARATVFATGTNQWLTFAQWPPQNTKPLVLDLLADHRLVEETSATKAVPAASGASDFEEWVSDPANPVPYIGEVRGGRKNEYMNDDQRFAMARHDVLYFQTEPLKEDITIAGPIRADLRVSTTGTDADFVTKVIDVYPGEGIDQNPTVAKPNYHKLVRAEVMRARYRDSYSNPKAMVPGQVTHVSYELRDVCHTFKKGHRIMVQVQSSWFPLVDRNPQTFVDIYHADESDFKRATHRLYRGSRIVLPLLTRRPVPLTVPAEYQSK